MSISTRAYNIAITSLAAAACLSCGGGSKSKSQGVDISIAPTRPIVITAKRIIDEKEITPPWFEFRATMTNNTDEPVTIIALKVVVSGIGASGTFEDNEVTVTPSDFNFRIGSMECKFGTFGTWLAGQSNSFQLSNGSSSCSALPIFVIGSNPGGTTATNFNYRVKIQPLGWFGTETESTQRFVRTLTFSTQ